MTIMAEKWHKALVYYLYYIITALDLTLGKNGVTQQLLLFWWLFKPRILGLSKGGVSEVNCQVSGRLGMADGKSSMPMNF